VVVIDRRYAGRVKGWRQSAVATTGEGNK
jgi:hypothetical protein